jgi:hypothetical protein
VEHSRCPGQLVKLDVVGARRHRKLLREPSYLTEVLRQGLLLCRRVGFAETVAVGVSPIHWQNYLYDFTDSPDCTPGSLVAKPKSLDG